MTTGKVSYQIFMFVVHPRLWNTTYSKATLPSEQNSKHFHKYKNLTRHRYRRSKVNFERLNVTPSPTLTTRAIRISKTPDSQQSLLCAFMEGGGHKRGAVTEVIHLIGWQVLIQAAVIVLLFLITTAPDAQTLMTNKHGQSIKEYVWVLVQE